MTIRFNNPILPSQFGTRLIGWSGGSPIRGRRIFIDKSVNALFDKGMKTNAKREIVYVSTERLRPFEANPRHNDDAVPKVVKSIETFGFINPIVVDKKYRICAGHTRYKAALAMGLTEVPIIIVPDLIGKKFEAFNVADNKTGEIADWDDDKLGALIKDLSESEFDTSVLGFTDGEISQILKRIENKLAGADPDDVPEAPKKAITKPGDLWILGEHRLLCGDATNRDVYVKLLRGLKPDAVVTDPPYGIGIKYDDFEETEEKVADLIRNVMPILLQFDPVVLTSGHRCMWDYPRPKWVMAWIHPAGMGRGPWGFNQFNPILCYGADPYLKNSLGGRPDSIVLAVDREGQSGHPCPKPVKLWKWLIERVTPFSQQLVLDPFCGSGTTIIACEELSRKCVCIELSPLYCDVAVKRWETFTGKKAVLSK